MMLRELITQYGLPLIFGNVLLESFGLPLPALPTLILTGAIASSGAGIGSAGLYKMVVVGTIAALLGDTFWFWLGRHYGSRVLRLLCKLSFSRDTCVTRSGDFFARHGVQILLFLKFIPGLSTLAIPVAGASPITFGSFLLFDAIGTAVWASAGVGVGAIFSGAIDTILVYADWMGEGALALAGVTLTVYIVLRWQRRVKLLRRLQMQRIDVTALYALLESERPPIVIDVRRDRHRVLNPFVIPGATVLEGDNQTAQLKGLPRDSKLVVYCDCPNEMSAALVAKGLVDHGFLDVAPLVGGMEAWRAAGYALEPLLLSAAMKENARALLKTADAIKSSL